MPTIVAEKRVERELRGIANDERSGANELAVRMLRLFRSVRPAKDAGAAGFRRSVDTLLRRAARARPTMAPVANAAIRLRETFATAAGGGHTAAETGAVLVRACDSVIAEVRDAGARAAVHFTKRFGQIRRPIVISYSSQVIEALRSLPAGRLRVTVCESRPALEGRRTARIVRAFARSVTVITEAAITLAIDDCDCVVIGCDTILRDGAVVNKTGSAILSMAASARGVPVIVLGTTLKFSRTKEPITETHAAAEVWPRAPQGITINNTYFEKVPAGHIRYLVLETGVFTPRRIAGLRSDGKKVVDR